MRGIGLFNQLFNERETSDQEQSKGRSAKLIQQRNQVLLFRYYFYGSFLELRYQSILERLQNEFFISQARIVYIISENQNALLEIRDNKPSISQLRAQFPFLNWPSA